MEEERNYFQLSMAIEWWSAMRGATEQCWVALEKPILANTFLSLPPMITSSFQSGGRFASVDMVIFKETVIGFACIKFICMLSLLPTFWSPLFTIIFSYPGNFVKGSIAGLHDKAPGPGESPFSCSSILSGPSYSAMQQSFSTFASYSKR